MVICDNFHQYQQAKSQNVKIALQLLRLPWIGFQIYLKGGVRIIPEEPAANGTLASVQFYLNKSLEYPIDYVRDYVAPPPLPGADPVASCAHPLLAHGAITDAHFYEKLREARKTARCMRRQ